MPAQHPRGGARLTLRFAKYQALGNDYLVIEPPDAALVTPALVRRLCDRHLGVGADGVLVPATPPPGSDFALAIWNPDGSEAEKSGNGLRIFARFLWDRGRVGAEPFTVATRGGRVRCQVRASGARIVVEMGRAVFAGPDEMLALAGGPLRVTVLSIGNPHCVVRLDAISPELARRLGPQLETHPRFPGRTNVQLVQVLARDRLQLEIWERGAGYTLASGSSACAAAAAAVRWGACDGEIAVGMPGGILAIGVGPDFELTLQGPAEPVFEGESSVSASARAARAAARRAARPPGCATARAARGRRRARARRDRAACPPLRPARETRGGSPCRARGAGSSAGARWPSSAPRRAGSARVRVGSAASRARRSPRRAARRGRARPRRSRVRRSTSVSRMRPRPSPSAVALQQRRAPCPPPRASAQSETGRIARSAACSAFRVSASRSLLVSSDDDAREVESRSSMRDSVRGSCARAFSGSTSGGVGTNWTPYWPSWITRSRLRSAQRVLQVARARRRRRAAGTCAR